jgi:hypothetical protein
MKLISKELGGTNSISYNEAQLTAAYVEIINSKWLNSTIWNIIFIYYI